MSPYQPPDPVRPPVPPGPPAPADAPLTAEIVEEGGKRWLRVALTEKAR